MRSSMSTSDFDAQRPNLTEIYDESPITSASRTRCAALFLASFSALETPGAHRPCHGVKLIGHTVAVRVVWSCHVACGTMRRTARYPARHGIPRGTVSREAQRVRSANSDADESGADEAAIVRETPDPSTHAHDRAVLHRCDQRRPPYNRSLNRRPSIVEPRRCRRGL